MSYRIINHKKTVIDYNKLKIFKYERGNLLYNNYDPLNLRYMYTHRHGRFFTPKNMSDRNIDYLTQNYEQAKIYSKLFKPLNMNYTVTGNFPKHDVTPDLQDFKMILIRSNKEYKPNQIKFLVDMSYSKPEIKQILMKLYGINPLKISTAIVPGRVKRDVNAKINKYMKLPDKKVAVIDLDKNVPSKFREIPKNKLQEYKDNEKKRTLITKSDSLSVKRQKEINRKNKEIDNIRIDSIFKGIPQNKKILFRLSEVTNISYAENVCNEAAYFNKNIHLQKKNNLYNFIEEIENVSGKKIADNTKNYGTHQSTNIFKYIDPHQDMNKEENEDEVI